VISADEPARRFAEVVHKGHWRLGGHLKTGH
jgi:hypothetical protein